MNIYAAGRKRRVNHSNTYLLSTSAPSISYFDNSPITLHFHPPDMPAQYLAQESTAGTRSNSSDSQSSDSIDHKPIQTYSFEEKLHGLNLIDYMEWFLKSDTSPTDESRETVEKALLSLSYVLHDTRSDRDTEIIDRDFETVQSFVEAPHVFKTQDERSIVPQAMKSTLEGLRPFFSLSDKPETTHVPDIVGDTVCTDGPRQSARLHEINEAAIRAIVERENEVDVKHINRYRRLNYMASQENDIDLLAGGVTPDDASSHPSKTLPRQSSFPFYDRSS